MDPVKVIIFVAAFVLLLLLGRKLSGSGEGHEIPPPFQGEVPPVQGITRPVSVAEDEDAALDSSRLVGSDVPFPIKLPEIERNPDGRYNRPEFLNYYFEKTDLKNGPADPTNFCDDFYVTTRDIENNQEFHYRYLAATPAGLQSVMTSEHLPALYIEGQMVIVPRWDVALILDAVVKQIMKSYSEPDDKETHALPNQDV
jgi:hypothetical protein